MEILGVLSAIFGLLIVIGVPYLLISHSGLKRRVRALELRAEALSAALNANRQDTPDSQSAPRPAAPAPAKAEAPDNTPAEISATPASPPSPKPTPDPEPRAYVFRQDRLQALGRWLGGNWPLALAGLSLALAGVFMVQYGVENGLLTPVWRVIGALTLGAALIAGGEVIRRRHGDDTDTPTGFLPSTLSAAGLVSLFAGILAARGLYGLIGPTPALAGLVAVAALAIVLGWFHGPLLAAGGIIGATAAPFLVGGSSDAPWLFYYYFALIAAAGLAVDTVKRWAWVSALVLIATTGASWLIFSMGAGGLHFLIGLLIVTALTLIVPNRSLTPTHDGTSLLGAALGRHPLPDFPTRLAIGMIPAAAIGGVLTMQEANTLTGVWQAVAMLALMLGAALIWLRNAPALADLTLAPALALLAGIVLQAAYPSGPLHAAFAAAPEAPPETPLPLSVSILLAIAAAGSALAFWRMKRAAEADTGPTPAILWAIGAACFAATATLLLDFTWHPASVLGSYGWALHALAVAALMTLLAERTAATPDKAERRLRTALFAVSALTMIALALFLLLSQTALTLALSVMVLGVALIDRRYDLPLLGWFIQLGVIVIGYRLIVDPGVIHGIEATFPEAMLAYGGPLALLAAGWKMLDHRAGQPVRIVVESGIWTLSAVFACVLLFQIMGENDMGSHWGMGLLATVWFASAANQLYRLRMGGRLFKVVRLVLAALFALAGLGAAALQATLLNPLFKGLFGSVERVQGPPVLDSLAVAYLPLAAVFAVAAWRLDTLPRLMRRLLAVISAGYAACYIALEIRRLWRGPVLSVPDVTQPELYSYTVAMMIAALGALLVAFWRRSTLLRRVAMAGVALTVAKVFLIDMAGLSGLIRVASFLGLGLALAGLAWLDRMMSAQWGDAPRTDDSPG
ncbi:Uncharacterized membrane protein [Roseovarius pacificus]|uniref:Uncharacterized membrane protein n=1 Tax=Roseovarius pacificus TaxID=337701 RepID=A0A1M7BEV5_9RHOB|nr:DUF2339 domain-containing protein [Roseovarius pacificus]GGO55000.1 hypothetical protein GCM10011315_16490 [Roseovarius pacificus]SHL53487.1 Uncharacterized membrane protein [Roseovarius pacificus]